MIDICMVLDQSVSPHTDVRTIQNTGIFWQAVFLAASPLVTAPPSNFTRLYYNGSAGKSHSTTTQYRQLRSLQ